jgi:hypothetical protein
VSAPENVENHVFVGKTGHHVLLEKLLDLLEFVIIQSNWAVTIQAKNIDTLWKLMVLSPNFQQDQTLFFAFINKKRSKQTRYTSMDQNNQSYTHRQNKAVSLFTAEE